AVTVAITAARWTATGLLLASVESRATTLSRLAALAIARSGPLSFPLRPGLVAARLALACALAGGRLARRARAPLAATCDARLGLTLARLLLTALRACLAA